MKFILIATSIILLSVSVWALSDKEEGKSYFVTPEGKIQEKETRFIDVQFEEKKLEGGLMLYSGLCKWKEGTGADGQPVIVPVKLFRMDKANKRLSLIAAYYTEKDGKFYLVTKDDGGDYVIGPVTNQAQNMPEKVKQFFENLKKQKQR